jgi:hypothetical protein
MLSLHMSTSNSSSNTNSHGCLLPTTELVRAEQSRAVAYCRQPASMVTLGIEALGPMAIYLFSVKTFVFFLLLLLFLL